MLNSHNAEANPLSSECYDCSNACSRRLRHSMPAITLMCPLHRMHICEYGGHHNICRSGCVWVPVCLYVHLLAEDPFELLQIVTHTQALTMWSPFPAAMAPVVVTVTFFKGCPYQDENGNASNGTSITTMAGYCTPFIVSLVHVHWRDPPRMLVRQLSGSMSWTILIRLLDTREDRSLMPALTDHLVGHVLYARGCSNQTHQSPRSSSSDQDKVIPVR